MDSTKCYEAGHMTGTDASEGQALWQPGGAEEDSHLREGDSHLHLAYDEEEEEDWLLVHCGSTRTRLSRFVPAKHA